MTHSLTINEREEESIKKTRGIKIGLLPIIERESRMSLSYAIMQKLKSLNVSADLASSKNDNRFTCVLEGELKVSNTSAYKHNIPIPPFYSSFERRSTGKFELKIIVYKKGHMMGELSYIDDISVKKEINFYVYTYHLFPTTIITGDAFFCINDQLYDGTDVAFDIIAKKMIYDIKNLAS